MARLTHRIPIPAPVMREAVVRTAAVPPVAKRHPNSLAAETPAPAPVPATVEETVDVAAELHDDLAEP